MQKLIVDDADSCAGQAIERLKDLLSRLDGVWYFLGADGEDRQELDDSGQPYHCVTRRDVSALLKGGLDAGSQLPSLWLVLDDGAPACEVGEWFYGDSSEFAGVAAYHSSVSYKNLPSRTFLEAESVSLAMLPAIDVTVEIAIALGVDPLGELIDPARLEKAYKDGLSPLQSAMQLVDRL